MGGWGRGASDEALACVSSCVAYGDNSPAEVRGAQCADCTLWLVQRPTMLDAGLMGGSQGLEQKGCLWVGATLLLLLRACRRFQAPSHHFDRKVSWRARLEPALLHRLRHIPRPCRVPHELPGWRRPAKISLGTR